MSDTRDQIIQATCDLLETQGYYATGLNQIIKESGSPKGSLYYYFPGGKEALAEEAVTRVGEVVLRRIRDNLAALDDPAEAVTAFIKNIAVNVERSGYRAGGPITTIALETASASPRLRAACDDIYSRWQAAFADKLIAGGVTEADARHIATVVISAIEGGVILCRTRQSRAPLEAVAESMGKLVQHAT